MSLLKELKPLFAVDHLTARAFMYSLTLEQLPRVVDSSTAHPSEIVRAIEEKLFDTTKGKFLAKMTVLQLNELAH